MISAKRGAFVSKFHQLYLVAAPLFRRDISARYRGSVMGLAWTFLVPLLMLAVYTFMFGKVFQMRWSPDGVDEPGGTLGFALTLFVGLMTHSYATEVLTRAPTIILSNANLVKRVVFPLEIFPVMAVSTALFQYFISLIVFLIFQVTVTGTVSVGVLWLPVIILPFTILLIGFAWVLASVTVYFRDVAQFMGLAATVLLFMSPVFYPVSRLPQELWPIFLLNPLTFIIEQSRVVVFTQAPPDFAGLAFYFVISLAVAIAGYFAFARMRRGFSDVL
ncbi:lipopolysaccharide transport system permease protein [Rhizobium rosettiformans]|uniref:Transport permease protein n=2 Tax=Rhizobium rosettiformans TaxID=1368430 RepID=A0A4S8PRG5_9HYPH|nr:ABC transporter permease [Rhizobium rosettiformans]MBB5278494.1 lipopolysaccharide transport system permease protein [Rhizobium rosettiformans]THV31089.1 ABC transporter permease [Rhizobium rosettiformans W3]